MSYVSGSLNFLFVSLIKCHWKLYRSKLKLNISWGGKFISHGRLTPRLDDSFEFVPPKASKSSEKPFFEYF